VSAVLYAIRFDYEDGAAFMFFFFGTIIMGFGLAALGRGFRSLDQVSGWSTALVVLGIYLALFFPLFFILGSVLDIDISGDLAGAIWISTFIVQALAWVISGVITLAVYGQPDERPAELTG